VSGLVLALDLGTTGARALLVDAGGQIRAAAYRTLGVRYPAPGRVEQDPAEMWETSIDLARQALREAGAGAGDVDAVGVVNQRSTTVAWDSRNGRPLAPAIGWQDQRTSERVAGFRAIGIPMTTLASATKLEWWMENDRDLREAAAAGRLCVGNPDAWLTWKLTGGSAHVTDASNASGTALFDLNSGDWSPPLLELFKQDANVLPRIVPTSEVVGETPADLLGAPIPVAARAGDQQAATFAQGAHAPGDAKLTLGTSAMLDLNTGGEVREAPPGTYALALWTLGDGTRAFCLEGTVITAGSAVDWLVELGIAPDAQSLDRLARDAGSSAGVVFVPALQGLGTPFLDDGARGLIGGLTRGNGAGHLARAALDGVAHRCVDLTDALELPPAPLHVDGGLAQSGFLVQRIADLSGRSVLRAAETETTALGSAFLAGLAVGIYADPTECRVAAPPRVFEPTWDAARRDEARAAWARAVERARSSPES
jgi:glycerol kinase